MYDIYTYFKIQLFLQKYIHSKIYLFVNSHSIIFQVLISSYIIIYNPIILWKSTISQHIKIYYAIFSFNNYFLFKMKETHIYNISFLYFYNEQWISFSFSINFIEYNMYFRFKIQLFLQRYIHPKIYLFVNIHSIIFQVLMLSSCIII